MSYWKTWLSENQENTAKKENTSVKPLDQSSSKKKKCKICCVCPAERQVRDECLLLRASIDECQAHIDAFYKCLEMEGFSQEDIERLRRSAKY